MRDLSRLNVPPASSMSTRRRRPARPPVGMTAGHRDWLGLRRNSHGTSASAATCRSPGATSPGWVVTSARPVQRAIERRFWEEVPVAGKATGESRAQQASIDPSLFGDRPGARGLCAAATAGSSPGDPAACSRTCRAGGHRRSTGPVSRDLLCCERRSRHRAAGSPPLRPGPASAGGRGGGKPRAGESRSG